MTSGTRPVRVARGTGLSCLGWQRQEAALRVLQNNLDPENAERPDDLVVYGGSGKAARNWACFDVIVDTLRTLRGDETLLVRSGKPVGVVTTHEWAPRVLLANSNLAGQKLERVLTNDPGIGVIRHVDAGYERADEVAAGRGVRVPVAGQP